MTMRLGAYLKMGKDPKSYTQRRHAGLYKRVIERARAAGLNSPASNYSIARGSRR